MFKNILTSPRKLSKINSLKVYFKAEFINTLENDICSPK